MADTTRRVAVGFLGTQVLQLRLSEDQLAGLRRSLTAGTTGWHDIETEEGPVAVKLEAVVFLRVDAAARGVGFGG
jgi:hypothetical protein